MARPTSIKNREQTRQAKRALAIVLKKYSVGELSAKLSVKRSTVDGWVRQGFVSTLGALAIDKLGIPNARKGNLRPDVQDWDREFDKRKSYRTRAYVKLAA